MGHVATSRFWRLYDELPIAVRQLADKSFELRDRPAKCMQRVAPVASHRVPPLIRSTVRRLVYHHGVAKVVTRQGRIVHQETKAQIGGLPLISVALGRRGAGDRDLPRAHGIIALGDDARGVLALGRRATGFIALGGRARGVFAMGGRAQGVFAMGGMAMGLVAVGGVALGLVAVGGAALGIVALGGASAGYVAVGGATAGKHTFPGARTPNRS